MDTVSSGHTPSHNADLGGLPAQPQPDLSPPIPNQRPHNSRNLKHRPPASHNKSPAPNRLPTPVSVDKFSALLKGYNRSKFNFLVRGFSHGFHLGYTGPRQPRLSQNKPSASAQRVSVSSKIATELSLGRIAGPYSQPPFSNFQISPIFTVPKKEQGEFRMIHDLSYPVDQSINSSIPHELSTVQYATLDDAVRFIQGLGPGCLLAKTDIDSAFRLIPVHPSDYELLGFMWEGEYYFDKCLPMGASSSCAIFEAFSTSLQWISEAKLGIGRVIHVLDDFLFLGAPDTGTCLRSLRTFIALCSEIGVPIKDSKTVLPSTCIQFLGITLDTVLMEARLPLDKIQKLRSALNNTFKKRTIRLRDLQSLLGLLNFACRVIVPGRAFMQRLYKLTAGVVNPRHHVTLNQEARRDLAAWKLFLDFFNGKSMLLDYKWVSAPVLNLATDSAGSLGFAAIFGSHYLFGRWPQQWLNFDITDKELLPIVLAVEIWGNEMENRCIVFHCDNIAVVHIINKQSAKKSSTMVLVRRLVLACMTHNLLFQALHIPGAANILADTLSRLQVARFKALSVNMDPEATPVPARLLQI